MAQERIIKSKTEYGSSEETVQAKVRGCSPGKKVKLKGRG